MQKLFILFLVLAILLSGCIQPPQPPEPPEPPVPSSVEIFFQPMQCIQVPWGENDSEQAIKDFYATADIVLVSVERLESGNDVCDACYECITSHYLKATVLAQDFDRMISFGWLEALPEPDSVSLSYTVEEVLDDELDANSLGPEVFSTPPFKTTTEKDLGELVLNKRILSACYPMIIVQGKLVSEKKYDVSLSLPPDFVEEENCLFDVEISIQGLPEEIEFVNVIFEDQSDRIRPNDTSSDGTVPTFFQPMQCEDFPWGESISGTEIEAFYLANHQVALSEAKRVESGFGVCAACYECPTSFFFEARIFEADEEKMISLGWQIDSPID